MALWTPALIDAALWLDADDADTFTLDGSAVSEWRDKSGNARHYAQPDAAKRPTISGSYVVFSGTQGLSRATADSPVSTTAFVVFTSTTLPGNGAAQTIYRPRPSGAFHEFLLANISGYLPYTVRSNYLGSGAAVGISTALTTSATLFDYSYNGGGNAATASYEIRLNGALSTVATSGLLGAASTDLSSIGSRISSGNAIEQGLIGQISEIVEVQGVTTLADRQKTEGYLAHKWGLAANLPADHPYKTAAPVLFSFTGTTRDKTGALAARTVTAIRELDQTVVGTITSDAGTGEFEIVVLHDEAHTLIFSGEADRNAIVYSGVVPE